MLQQMLCTGKMLCTDEMLLTGGQQICRYPLAFSGRSADFRELGRFRLLPAQVLPQAQVLPSTQVLPQALLREAVLC